MMTNEKTTEQLEFTACGPRARLSREGLRDLILLFLGSLALALFIKWGFRDAGRPGSASTLWGSGAVAAAGLVAYLFARIFRRDENWTLYLGATLVASMLAPMGGLGSTLGLVMAILSLPAIGLVIVAYVRMTRHADELQRHILHRALAFAVTVGVSASLAWSVLEAAGLPRLPAIAWCGLLVISWAAGLAVFSRGYR
jgi:hypothetical protein